MSPTSIAAEAAGSAKARVATEHGAARRGGPQGGFQAAGEAQIAVTLRLQTRACRRSIRII